MLNTFGKSHTNHVAPTSPLGLLTLGRNLAASHDDAKLPRLLEAPYGSSGETCCASGIIGILLRAWKAWSLLESYTSFSYPITYGLPRDQAKAIKYFALS
jgi:hypothetical protein